MNNSTCPSFSFSLQLDPFNETDIHVQYIIILIVSVYYGKEVVENKSD